MEFDKFVRSDRWPHIFCPGCGIGTVLNTFYEAFDAGGFALDRTVFVSGIGCSSRISGYIRADSMHTTHGRPLAFATGVALANPGLRVVVFTGDGDLGAIGGNHFINACRRNADMTVVCINNYTYGMTGGQSSTATPQGWKTTTAPGGSIETPFDLARLAVAAGANYSTRWTTFHLKRLVPAFREALSGEGFRFVEVISQCPVSLGKSNRMPEPADFLKWFKEHSVVVDGSPGGMKGLDENGNGKIEVGTFVKRNRPSLLRRMGLAVNPQSGGDSGG